MGLTVNGEPQMEGGGGASTAEEVSYSGVVPGANVKEALDHVGANLGEIETTLQRINGELQ